MEHNQTLSPAQFARAPRAGVTRSRGHARNDIPCECEYADPGTEGMVRGIDGLSIQERFAGFVDGVRIRLWEFVRMLATPRTLPGK